MQPLPYRRNPVVLARECSVFLSPAKWLFKGVFPEATSMLCDDVVILVCECLSPNQIGAIPCDLVMLVRETLLPYIAG